MLLSKALYHMVMSCLDLLGLYGANREYSINRSDREIHDGKILAVGASCCVAWNLGYQVLRYSFGLRPSIVFVQSDREIPVSGLLGMELSPSHF